MASFLRVILFLLLALAGFAGLAMTACSGIFLVGRIVSGAGQYDFTSVSIVCLFIGVALLIGAYFGYKALQRRNSPPSDPS